MKPKGSYLFKQWNITIRRGYETCSTDIISWNNKLNIIDQSWWKNHVSYFEFCGLLNKENRPANLFS